MENNQNDFDTWNTIKKRINSKRDRDEKDRPKKGEVWLNILGKNIGYEQNGAGDYFLRPVLVIKKFNNKMFWVVPLSTKQKNIDFYINYTDTKGQNASVIVSQLRLVSINRFKRKLYIIDSDTFAMVIQKIFHLLS